MTRLNKPMAILLGLISTSLLFAQDKPQDRPGADFGLEEIVVSARKRDENLVNVPISITAITDAMIENTGINSVAELAQQTPGLSFRPAFGRVGSGQGGGSSNRPTLRGQSNILGIPNVGFFVDGVFVSGNITSYQLDNLERIEVIRGPQSALFGRGTFAGAVNFITRKPGNEVKGKFEATRGLNNHSEVNGYYDFPIVQDKLFAEISLRHYERGGDWYNRATRKKDGGEESTENASVKLYWKPSETFDLEFNAGFSKDVDGTFAGGYTGINCLLPRITSVNAAGIPQAASRSRGYWCGEVNIDNQTDFYSRYDIIDKFGLHGVDRETLRTSLKANADIGDWTLTGIAAYNKFRNEQAFESGFNNSELAGRPLGLSATQDRRRDWSAEFRIASPVDKRIHGLFGAYYYRENDGAGYNGTFGVPAGVIPVPLGATNITLDYVPVSNDSAVKNWSTFAAVDFDINDRLKLTAEGRYQVDTIINDQLTNARIPSNLTNLLLEKDFKKFLPRMTALFNLTSNWNLYGNVAKGNKPGGFNSLPANASAASLAQLQAQFQAFNEEDARTIELGIKGGNEARTLQLSASIYQIDWDNQQLTLPFLYTTTTNTPSNSTAIVNAGKTKVKGAEIDLSYRPFESLNLRFAYALADAKIVDFVDFETADLYDTDGRVGTFDLAGDPNGQTAGAQLPQSPKHQVILSADYRRPLTDNIKGFVRGDLTYESKRYDQVHNLSHTGTSNLLNLRTGIELKDWTLTLWMDNALDDRTPASLTRLLNFGKLISVPPVIPGNARQTTFYRDILISYPRKRTYGFTARYAF